MREAQLKLQKNAVFSSIHAFEKRLLGLSRSDTAALLGSTQQIFSLILEEQWLGLIERGNCLFNDKAHNVVNKHKSSGFILYNSNDPEAKNSIMNISGESIKAKRSSASSHFIAVS